MKNIININTTTGAYNVKQESGADAVVVSFKNITGSTNQVELYQGNEYKTNLPCRTLNGSAETTLPAEVFTGNNLHFRLIQDGTPGPFYHIVYEPKNSFIFEAKNSVIYSNKDMQGYTIAGSNLNTYGDLEPYTQDDLEAYNYGTLRGGTL